jgi:hypothetical protein
MYKILDNVNIKVIFYYNEHKVIKFLTEYLTE